MTVALTIAQVQERLTVTLTVTSAASLPSAVIIVDGKAYTGIWTSGSYVFVYDIALERGSHTIYAQATDSVGTVSTSPITYVMAYELTEYGIDLFSGDAKLDVIEPLLHDALLPDLPTLNFSCAALLTGNIQAVIRERGLRKYQFEIATVAISGPLYVYTCKAAESYALTTAIMALQTAYGATSDAIRLLVPSLNIVNVNVPTHSTVNLISNGDFEANTLGWQVNAGSGTISRETGSPLAGTGSLKYVQAAGDLDWGIYNWVNVTVGHSYIITALVKSTATAGRKVGCWALGHYVSIDCSASVQPISVSFVADGPTVGLTFMLDGVTAGDYFLLDSVVCYDLTDVSSVNLLAQTIYPQLYMNIAPTEVIKQLLIQSLAQASVRNGNLYVFPLDVSGQIPDYHMQRADSLTGWQKDADTFDAVIAHYIVKQFPTPDTVLTLHDAANWYGTVTDVTQVADTLLPVPSGALGMLKSVGDCRREGLSAAFKLFDRVRFNWRPPDVGATVKVSLQRDVDNKLELTHTFAGESGMGFSLQGSPGVSTDTLTKNIILSPIQFVTTVEGTTTGSCSYRVTLLNAADAIIWQDAWAPAFGNTFRANVPTSVSQVYQAAKVRIEFTGLYLIGANYGVQCITCDITVQAWTNVGSHVSVVSSVTYSVTMSDTGNYVFMGLQGLPAATSGQWYEVSFLGGGPCDSLTIDSEHVHAIYYGDGSIRGTYYISVVATLRETITDYAWVHSLFEWSSVFNLFEAVDIPLASMTRTGNPTNLATIALTFTGDNYIDTLAFVADNPLPVTVRAGTGSRAYTVTDDFGSEAGAQAYADGLLPVVSVAREQYTRDVSLETDLSVGDTISGDGVPMTVYAVDYRQSGKTLAAGRAMDVLMTRLAEQARRIGALERKA